MHWLDIAIIGAVFAVVAGIALVTRRYVHGVESFLAADRCAERYLLTLADGIAGLGAISIIGAFQQQYQAGFGASWWAAMMGPVYMVLTLSGFIAYRFRETRAMTIAEFYEMRYSRRFRIFAGMLAWFAGILNYGVFPSVTARFVIYFCGIPRYDLPLGPLSLDLTLGAVMAVMLGAALLVTFRGGQIAIMVTDFLQAQFVNVVFLIVLVVLFAAFSWTDLTATLKAAAPDGQSMLNPFDQAEIPDFNVAYFGIMAFSAVYSYMAWQGNQGYNCSARTPHEAKMARVLATWRFGVTWTVISLIPIFVFVLMHSPATADLAQLVSRDLAGIADEGVREQMRVPIALREFLPVGVLGLFAACMIAAAISTDDTYLHSWGSIFIQDVVLPMRGRPLTRAQHLTWLRRSIFGVAAFAWVFGMAFSLQEYIFMYWAITGAIYVGGAGSVIIGGFYWKRATTAGAWAGMITGCILGLLGVLINNILWPKLLPLLKARFPNAFWLVNLPHEFWLDGAQLFFIASLCAVAMYVVFSLLTRPDPAFSMNKMLHRGAYALEADREARRTIQPGLIQRMLGIDNEYARGDKIIAWTVFVWTMYGFGVFVVGTVIGLTFETTEDGWATWWLISTIIGAVIGGFTVLWFLWSGFRDLRALFVTLREAGRRTKQAAGAFESAAEAGLGRSATVKPTDGGSP